MKESSKDRSRSPVDCEETVHRLYHFLDGELTDDRRRAIKEHLERCAPCEEVYVFEAELRRVIADRCKDHVPEQLLSRIRTAIEGEQLKANG